MEALKERSELKLEVLSHIISFTIRGSKEGKGQNASESATRDGGRKCRCGSIEQGRFMGENRMLDSVIEEPNRKIDSVIEEPNRKSLPK